MKREKLEKLATEKNIPCVTVSMNTSRTYPENQNDIIVLKTLIEEAKNRVIKEYGKHPVIELIGKLNHIVSEIDVNYNLDSMHIFLSNSTNEKVYSPWSTTNAVHVSESFAVKPLIKMFNRTEEYLILILTQSNVRLLMAVNDAIVSDINNADFSFADDEIKLEDIETTSNENKTHEFFNKIDKAMVKVNNKTDLKCVVISTSDNYNRFLKVADKPSIYLGWTNLSQDNSGNTLVAKEAWKICSAQLAVKHVEAIEEIQEAVGKGLVITELSEIYRAAKDGRGDLLIVNDNFHQAVRVTDEFSLDLITDVTLPGVIDDITSEIAWEVISKKGRAIFTTQDELKSLGDIALKVRY